MRSKLSSKCRWPTARLLLGAGLLALASAAQADTIYRSTGEHGEPVFSDHVEGAPVQLRDAAFSVSDPEAVAERHDDMLAVALALAAERRADAQARSARVTERRRERAAAAAPVVVDTRYVAPPIARGFYRPRFDRYGGLRRQGPPAPSRRDDRLARQYPRAFGASAD
ncbi:MAG: DUF4124 domain-containing protein [Pseudomonadota bacterium]